MITRLGEVPLVLGSESDGFKLIIDLICELSLVITILEFVIIVDSIDCLALISHLHEQVRVVVGLLGVEVDVRRNIYLKFLIDPLVHLLLVQALSVDTHLLQ